MANFSKKTKRTLQAVFHSTKRISEFFIFFGTIVFIWAGLGYKVFEEEVRSFETDDFYDKYVNDYSGYWKIANSLVVSVTFDNYPLVMRPFVSQSWLYLMYFMPYIMLNILFFIPIPITIVYDGFRDKRTALAIKDNLKEKEALFACYLTLTMGEYA